MDFPKRGDKGWRQTRPQAAAPTAHEPRRAHDLGSQLTQWKRSQQHKKRHITDDQSGRRLDGFRRVPPLLASQTRAGAEFRYLPAASSRTPQMEQSMNKFLAATVACGLMASPAFALDAKIADAIKTFEAIEADADKLKIYCDMSKLMASAADDEDEAKAEALDKQMDEYAAKLGPEFETALDAGADLDPDSEDGKAYDAALDNLDGKCGT
jgi:hypothetical protein